VKRQDTLPIDEPYQVTALKARGTKLPVPCEVVVPIPSTRTLPDQRHSEKRKMHPMPLLTQSLQLTIACLHTLKYSQDKI
jgi:hypothetical protein